MNEPVLLARVEPEEEGRLRVLSPGVGWWSDPPSPGSHVGPGTRIGTLLRGKKRFALLLPAGAAGSVDGPVRKDRSVAVEYGETLLVLSPAGASVETTTKAQALPAAGLPAGTWAVVSPTDGTFYQRASPDAAAFVEPGSRVREGQPVGLVEVMKTFNQVLYGGPGFPEEAEVVEVRCMDAEEVHAGQVLVVVRSC